MLGYLWHQKYCNGLDHSLGPNKKRKMIVGISIQNRSFGWKIINKIALMLVLSIYLVTGIAHASSHYHSAQVTTFEDQISRVVNSDNAGHTDFDNHARADLDHCHGCFLSALPRPVHVEYAFTVRLIVYHTSFPTLSFASLTSDAPPPK